MIASICSDPSVLKIMRIVNIFISIIRIVVPILLIFVLMFKLISAITNNDKDSLAKVKKTVPSNIIAAVIIFLIPNVISIVVKITFPNNDYKSCIKNISIEQIEIAYINRMDDLVRKAEETLDINDYNNAMLYLRNITDESKRKEYEKILSEIKSQIDEMNATVEEPEIDQSEIVETARKYIGQNVGRDCSGFVKHNVLRPLNYLQDDISSASGYCDGRSRGSYGMYLKYKEKGQEVWHRDSSARKPSDILNTFPGDCVPGDLIFYSYGVNDCVKHIVIYAGFENGKEMIIDSNMYDNIVRYRAVDAVSGNAIPLACVRPINNEG